MDNTKRSSRLLIYVTEEELQHIWDLAYCSGFRSLSRFVYEAILTPYLKRLGHLPKSSDIGGDPDD